MKSINPKTLGLNHVSAIQYDDAKGGWTVTTARGYTFKWYGTDPRKLDELAALVDAIAYLLKTGQV